MSSTVTESEVWEVLQSVTDPEIGQTLFELNMLESVDIGDGGAITVRVCLPTVAYPDRERISAAISSVIMDHGFESGPITVTFSHRVRGKESGGKIGLKVKNVVAVGSGKGGVGKSTIAAAIAFGLKNAGARVGLLDADVYGPSIPHLVGVRGNPGIEEVRTDDGRTLQRIQPIEHNGIKLLSIGFMIEEDQAVIWRGPMLHSLLTQFLQDTDWGELDYLIIDFPPGTGDVALTLSQLLELAGAVIVCTPQKVALLDAVKAISMFRQMKIPVLGVVENLSGAIFGRGGARTKAEELGVPFLGEVPSLPEICVKGDEGQIAELLDEGSPARPHLQHVCEQMSVEIVRQLVASPELPSLEVL